MSKDFFDNLTSAGDATAGQSGMGDFAIISYAQDLPATFAELQGAEFSRQEGSLKIVFEDKTSSILVKDYFLSSNDGLVTQDGAGIPHAFVETFLLGDTQLLAALSGSPQRFIGSVEKIDGAVAMVDPSGTRTLLSQDDLIAEGSQILTAKGARVELQMEDGSTLTLAGNARVSLDEINFDADSGGGSIIISLLRGIFSFASGLVARAEPENVILYTPTSEIGLRGTKIAGEVAADGKAKIVLIGGRIEVTTKGGSINIDRPLGVTEISGDGSAPGPIQQLNMQNFLGQFDGLFENAQELRSFARAKEAQQANEQVLEANADSQAEAASAPTNPALFSQRINFDQASNENAPDTSAGEAGDQNDALGMKIGDYLKEIQKIKLDSGDDFGDTAKNFIKDIKDAVKNAGSGPITAEDLANVIDSLDAYYALAQDLDTKVGQFANILGGDSQWAKTINDDVAKATLSNEVTLFFRGAGLKNFQNLVEGLKNALNNIGANASLVDYDFNILNEHLAKIAKIRGDDIPRTGDDALANMEDAADAFADATRTILDEILTGDYIKNLLALAKTIAKATSLADDDQVAALEQTGYQSTSKEDHASLVDSEGGNS